MSMSGDNIETLYFSSGNLDNTYKIVSDEIIKRTNKDISKNSNFRATFNEMSKIVYNKCPPTERGVLMKINNNLVDKSITFFHNKIFSKQVNQPTEKQNEAKLKTKLSTTPLPMNTNTQHGFSMMNENEDLNKKFSEMMANRDLTHITNGIPGDGKISSYMPQTTIPANQYVNREVFTQGTNLPKEYNPQFQRVADQTIQNKLSVPTVDFSINAFNLSDDMTESLTGYENADTPLYKNLENLQKMDSANPMSMLEDYQRQRNQQIKNYTDIEKRENITSMKMMPQQENNIVFDRNNTDAQTKIDNTIVDPMELLKFGDKITQKYIERMEERIVNSNEIPTLSPDDIKNAQESMIKYQRDTQPKYIEKVHYINLNSVDRQWETNAENRYQFQVKFNQPSGYEGATIQQLYRNIISVELVSAILPMDASITPFDTRIYNGIMRYPYLLLRIDELDGVFRGTNNFTDRSFSTLIYDKVYFTNTLSNDYIAGTSTSNSIVQSSPKTAFAGEYLRGFMKFNPAYFEKKKFYNNPLASLNRMTITITDPRGNLINLEDDVLPITSIAFTNTLDAITANSTELLPSFAWPYSTQSNYKMVEITTTNYFSNRLFRIGDRIIIRDFTLPATGAGTANNQNFVNFITRNEGHVIINLQVETDGASNTYNRGYLNTIYIAPPGIMNSINQTVDSSTYYDNNIDYTGATYGTLINLDLQTHLMFRIVTRDPDTSGVFNPINVY